MKKMSLLLALLVAPAVLTWSTGASAADLKIGYVDMARAFNDLDDSKDAKERLKKDFSAKQKQLDEMQNKLKTKKDDFDKQSAMMKADIKEQKQAELQKELMELQQTYMQLQQELGKREQEVVADITKKLRKVVEKVGDREQYAIIFDIGDGVLYYKRHQDITEQVVREYNKEYGKK
jgi:outer membrane protein